MTGPTPHLTPKDTHVLSLLSLPSPTPTPPHFPTLAPDTPFRSTSPHEPSLASTETSILAPLNQPSPPQAALHLAITNLTTLLTSHPSYASAYNNRAQASRMLYGDDLRDSGVQKAGIWYDLGRATELAEVEIGAGGTDEGGEAEQESRKRVLSQAYTQRGWLVWRLSKGAASSLEASSSTSEIGLVEQGESYESEDGQSMAGIPVELQGLSQTELEEWASRDFERGGRYGNKAAAEMARATNPYARLCGSVVEKVMRREMNAGSLGQDGG